MTRFNEQLHKPSTSEEQDLTLTVVSEEYKPKILNLLGIAQSKTLFDIPIYICRSGSSKCCGMSTGPNWYLWHNDSEACLIDGCRKCHKSKLRDKWVWREKCEELQCHNLVDTTCKKEFEKSTGIFIAKPVEVTWDVELERPSKNHSFIQGYMDIFIRARWRQYFDLKILNNINNNYGKEEDSATIVIECLPVCKTCLDPLRQIKTYMGAITASYNEYSSDRYPLGVIATYSNVPEQIKNLLLREKVSVLEVERKGDAAFNGNGQTMLG